MPASRLKAITRAAVDHSKIEDDVEEMAGVIEREYLQGSFLRNVQWTPNR